MDLGDPCLKGRRMRRRTRRNSPGMSTHPLGMVVLEHRRLLSRIGPDPGHPVHDASRTVDTPVVATKATESAANRLAVTATAATQVSPDTARPPGSGVGSRSAESGAGDQGKGGLAIG